jgi:hypothetical protein
MPRTYKGRNLDNVFAADPLTERDPRQSVSANGFDAELGRPSRRTRWRSRSLPGVLQALTLRPQSLVVSLAWKGFREPIQKLRGRGAKERASLRWEDI